MQQPSSLRTGFERIVRETDVMASAINTALDTFETHLDAPPPRKLLELGVLLAQVREGRARGEEFARLVPSPNQVPEHLREAVAEIGQALFAFVQSCEAREAIIGDMAHAICRHIAHGSRPQKRSR